MSKTPEEIKRIVDTLSEQVFVGKTCVLTLEGMNDYLKETELNITPVFINLTLMSFLDKALLHLIRFYDKRNDTLSVDYLIDRAKYYMHAAAHTRHLEKTINDWTGQDSERNNKIKVLRDFRNEHFVHLSRAVFDEVKPPDDETIMTLKVAKELYEDAGKLINDVYSSFSETEILMEIMGWEDFKYFFECAKLGFEHQQGDYT